MAENKLIIGSLPVLRGAYDSATNYYRDNQVTMYGSTFQSLVDENVGYPPAELREDGKVYAINTDKWIIVANAIDAYNAGERIANAETRIKELGEYADSPEFIRVYTDSEGKFLWGIRIDGTVEWAKGIPTPVKEAIRELENKLKTQDIKSLQDAIDVINASLKPLTDTFSFQDNEEFAHVITDANGKVLFGIKADGKPYFPKNTMYSVESNQEFLAAWLDASGHVLFGLRTDGSTYVAKADFLTKIEEIKKLLDENSIKDEEIATQVKQLQDIFSIVSNDEWLHAVVDAERKIIEATMQDGKKYLPKQELLEKYDDVEGRTEMTLDADGRILSYRDKDGVKHEEKLDVKKLTQDGKEINIDDLATKEDVDFFNIKLSELDGVQDHSLPNLFNKDAIRTYDSDFADKVFAKIGRKTAETGCYSNNIECKEGDWFTRSDFGTGIVVVLDEYENVLGDVANAAYQPTVQIVPAKPEYDFSMAKYVVFVVMLENLSSERIVKARYIPTDEGDYVTIPKLRVGQGNMDKDFKPFFKSSKGKYYQIAINDSGETPTISLVDMTGIPMSELPSDFPTYKVIGDFSEFYDGLIFCPLEGGVSDYLYELGPNGLVQRYLKQKISCPRILKEGDTWYCYGSTGQLNNSTGKLCIYKPKEETFEFVKGNVGGGNDGNLLIEPHDCLVISVNPLHYIYQRYVTDQHTIVDDVDHRVTSLHVGEIYDGNLLYEWHSEDYPELWVDSHIQYDNGDYLHNNTISVSSDGNLYLNNKHANQIIVLERTWNEEEHTAIIGNILWKIGGNRTHEGWDVPTRIQTSEEQQWYESHDAVINSNGLITMYDNRSSGASRILEFNIDTEIKKLTNFKSYTWEQYRGRYQGSADKLAEGIYLVSWGSQRNGNTANAGIYDFNTNKILFEIRFDATGSSAYRVYGIPKEQE